MPEEEFKNLHLQLAEDDVRKIDEWKASRGMKSRTEAIRSMIRICTGSDLDEGFAGVARSSLSEKDNSKFIKPDISTKKKNESVEDLIRKVVREELLKLKK